MKKNILSLLFIFLTACTAAQTDPTAPLSLPTNTPVPPTSTSTPVPTATSTPKPTATPRPEPVFVTLGSPFPEEWGTPRIWSNDAYNAPWLPGRNDDYHGHVDIAVPVGYSVCEGFDIDAHTGDIIAPISGFVRIYPDDPQGFDITPPENTYPDGIFNALKFAGIENPSLDLVTGIRYQFGHGKNITTGWVEKGDVIAEIEPYNSGCGQTKIAYKVGIYYEGVEYAFTPTLFTLDISFECYPDSPYDCEPEPNDYAPE